MWVRFIFFYFFVQLLRPGTALCTLSKYNEGAGNWVKCVASNLSEAFERGGPFSRAMTISQSKIPTIGENAFLKNANLETLTLHNCGLRDLHPNALAGLFSLKKLSLPSNNLTIVDAKWFASLSALEQLDLSFNFIRNIDSSVFAKLTNIRRLNFDDNLLTCLEPRDMTPMRSITKIRVLENPLSLTCRGKMSLWFKDKGINYSSDLPISGSWLDRVLWLCAEDGYGRPRTEKTMRECVLLNIFNQLRSALKTTNSFPISSQQCASEARGFLLCAARNRANDPADTTDGAALTRIVSNLRAVQEKLVKM